MIFKVAGSILFVKYIAEVAYNEDKNRDKNISFIVHIKKQVVCFHATPLKSLVTMRTFKCDCVKWVRK